MKPYKCRKCGGTDYKLCGVRRQRNCTVCALTRRKIWLLNNKEKYLATNLRYARDNAEKINKYNRDYRKKYKEKWRTINRQNNLKKLYGITIKDYDYLMDKQGGVCDICGNLNVHGRRLSVDHNHKTGAIRGLLCVHCNAGLGSFKDSDTLICEALAYLRRTKDGVLN